MSRPRSIKFYEDTISHTDPPAQQRKDVELLQKHPTFVNKAEKCQTSINIDMKDDYTDTEDSSLWVEDSNIDLDGSANLELQMLNQSETSDESLFPLLYKKNYEAFVSKANTYNVHYCDNRRHTYLQYACKFGLTSIVKVLLDLEVDPNKTVRGGRRASIMIAAYNGYFDIVKMLVDTKKIIYKVSDEGDNILHVLIIGALMREHKSEAIDTSRTLENTDFYQCLEYLLNNVPKNQLDINLLNRRHKTALHYAVSADDRDLIGLLLKHGAYIGVSNAQADMPIKFMKAATLQYFIDKSITMKRHTGRTMRKYPWIGLDYNLLACKNFSASVSETKPLVVISEVTHLRPLLKHPYFDAFLELKWNIIMKKLTLINYLFYLMYVLFNSSYLLVTYAPITTELASKNNTSPNNSVINSENLKDVILWYIVVLLNSVLFSREFLQFIIYSTSNKYRYIKNFVNWIELPLIIVTYIILFFKIDSVRNRSLLTVTAIFLSWLELMLLILSHPSRSVHILMFKVVAWNSLKFLLCYVILIIAFALSFYLLLKDTSPEFKNIILAVFKTWVMSVGEYQVSNSPFEQEFGVEHLFFVLFLFLVPIVMFNLLNGVAVSDIQCIRQDAELVNTVSRVNLIAHIEEIISDLLSFLNKLDYYYTTLVRRRSDSEATKCCDLLRQRFLLYINLFSSISDGGSIYISPHQDNRLLTKKRKLKGMPSVRSAVTLPKLYISSAVVDAIQEKLDEKAANQSNYFGDTGVTQPNTLLAFKDQLITMKNALGKTEDRLQTIEEKLTEILDVLLKEKL